MRDQPYAQKRFHLQGPRKHGKSQCVGINYPAWLIGKYPDIHITLVGKTATLVEQNLAEITELVEKSPEYHSTFGNIKPNKPQAWHNSQIYVNRPTISKFPTIHATGIYGPLTGGGNDLIIADDIIDQENVTTRAQIEKASLWFRKVLLTTLFPWGAVLVIGTRWSYDDLYSELMQTWKHEILRAILNENEIIKGKKPQVLWPEYWPYHKLMEKKKDLGTIIFNCQYQNDPTGMEGTLLKAEWLHAWQQPPPPYFYKYGSVDPALGEGDLAAIASWAYDSKRRILYLEDVWADAIPYPDFLRKIREEYVLRKYVKIYIETNAFQKAIMFEDQLKGLPLVDSATDKDKQRRFISMSSHFEASRILVNPLLRGRGEFWTEWIQFPKGRFDDALDAVEIGIRNILTQGDVDAWVLG